MIVMAAASFLMMGPQYKMLERGIIVHVKEEGKKD